MKSEIVIEVKNLRNFLSNRWVHSDVNLTVYKGETLSIIGGSGVGKSVLIKNICRLMTPTDGEVLVWGTNIHQLNHRELMKFQQRVGYVFQGAALFDSMNIYENVGFGLFRFTKKSTQEIYRIVDEKLEMVGLKNVGKLMPDELSGGMQKRAGIARAIAMEPKILFYDEPTTGIDPIMSDIINELIVELSDELDVTSIVVTHDMRSAYKTSDRIGMLHDGRIIGIGTPDEIRNTDNEYIKQFISGSSEGPISFE